MPKFKPARLVPKLFAGVPVSGATYDLSTFTSDTIAPYELALDSSAQTIVVNFNGTVRSFSAATMSGGLPAGSDGKMFYNSGGTWVIRDMSIRASDTANEWLRLASASSSFSASTQSVDVAGNANYLNGGYCSVFAGGQSSSMNAPGSAIISSKSGVIDTNTSTTKVYGNVILGSLDSQISGSSVFSVANLILGSQYSTTWETVYGSILSSSQSYITGGLLNSIIASIATVDNSSHATIISSTGRIIGSDTTVLIAGSGLSADTANGSAVIGGSNNMASNDSVVILACSGVTSSKNYTTYVNDIDIQHIIDLKPLSVVPTPVDGRVYFSASTGLMVCVGGSWKLITAV